MFSFTFSFQETTSCFHHGTRLWLFHSQIFAMFVQFLFLRKCLKKTSYPIHHVISNVFIHFIQVSGTIVLGIGIWLAVDKSSFISLLKMVENEHLEVSVSYL